MKRYLLILLALLVLVTSLCSCGVYTNEEEQTDEGKYESLSDTLSEDFYMKTECSQYGTDVEKIKLIFGRKDGEGFDFGYRYVVYVYEDGEWVKLPFNSSYRYILPAIVITNGEGSHTISVSDLNVKLKPGRYKVQKEFEDGSAYAEFVIK